MRIGLLIGNRHKMCFSSSSARAQADADSVHFNRNRIRHFRLYHGAMIDPLALVADLVELNWMMMTVCFPLVVEYCFWFVDD